MARKRIYTVLLIAMTVGAVFAIGTYRYVQARPANTPQAVNTAKVVVAASNMDVGAALRAEDLRAIDWPAGSVPEGAFHKADELVGRGLIQPVVAFEPILPGKLSAPEAGAGLPPVIPPGYRAVSVRVNEVIGVAGYVLPGTHVDVVATVSPTQQQTDMTSKVILTNVLVLAAGTKIERATDKDKPMPVSVVTLLVNPQEAERLTLAASEGKIQLALRNPLDQGAPATPGIKTSGLMGSVPAAKVQQNAGMSRPRAAQPVTQTVPAAAPMPTVEMIRGDKRATEVIR